MWLQLLNIKLRGVEWAGVEVCEIMGEADDDGNYRLDYDEFKKMLIITRPEDTAQPVSHDKVRYQGLIQNLNATRIKGLNIGMNVGFHT